MAVIGNWEQLQRALDDMTTVQRTITDDMATVQRTVTASGRTVRVDFPVPHAWRETAVSSRDVTPALPERKKDMSEVIPGDIHPVVPKIGALIRVKDNGNMGFFKDWKNGKVVLIDGNEYAREDVEALVPAHYGRSYERAVGMPETGNAGRVCAIRTWRNLNPVVQADGRGRTESWHPNTVAALAPVLDPATETTTQKMARLEREMKTLSDGLHDRMVAEGEARQWCAEFDSILDSTGLPPRVKRNIVEGTMTFRAAVNASDPNEILDEIRRSWTSYINTRDITISEIHVPDQSQVGPRLS